MMNNCGNCANYDRTQQKHTEVCGDCITAYVNDERQEPSRWKAMPMTNGDRIRAMTDEELAAVLADHENSVAFEVCLRFGLPSVSYDLEKAKNELLNWLKQPVED